MILAIAVPAQRLAAGALDRLVVSMNTRSSRVSRSRRCVNSRSSTTTDEGPLPPHPTPNIKYNMETVDDVIRDKALEFIDKAKLANKPFFVWLNPTRMHVVTHLSEKYASMRTPENGWSIEEAGMAQLDDIVGTVLNSSAR